MTELYINNVLVDTYPEAGIGITYAVGSVLTLDVKSGYYSNKFKLPKTSINNAVFGNSYVLNSGSQLPYSTNVADLYINGIAVILNGAALLNSVDDNYNVTILSGNVDFFDMLKNKTLADLDLSSFNHELSTTVVQSFRTATSGIIYPLVDCGKDTLGINYYENTTLGNQQITFHHGRQLPAIFLNSLFARIENFTGYTIDGTFVASDQYDRTLVFPSNFYKEITETVNLQQRISSDNTFFTSASRTYGVAVTGVRVDSQIAFNYLEFPYTATTSVFQPDSNILYKIDMDLQLKWTVPIGGTGVTALYIGYAECDASGVFITSSIKFCQEEIRNVIYESPTKTGTPVLQEIDIDFQGTFYVRFESGKYYRPYLYETIDSTGGSGTYQTILKIVNGSKIEYSETEIMFPYDTVDCDVCFTQKVVDLLKDMMKINNLIAQTNPLTKTFSLNYFDELEDNLTIAEDWTNKADLSKQMDITFVPNGWGQTNNFKYLNESIYDSSINISNANLPLEYDALTIGAESCLNFEFTDINTPFDTFYMPKLNCVEIKEAELTLIKGVPVHYALLNRYNPTISLYYSNLTKSVIGTIIDAVTIGTNAPFAYFYDVDKTDSLDMASIITNYYKITERIFSNFKYATMYFNLSSTDISKLDFTIPIYLDLPNIEGWFYLQNISNFKSGTSVKCELIKI